MSVVMMGGVPTSGNGTIVKRVIRGFDKPELVEPMSLFPFQRDGDVLIVGRYPDGEMCGETGHMTYGAVSKFSEFILQEYPKHRHMVIEGNRFFTMKNIEWFVSGFESKMYVLQVSQGVQRKRHYLRDKQTEILLKGKQTQIQHVLTNLVLMGHLEIRSTEPFSETESVVNEISDLLR